jgi:hypothetical protein
MMHTDQRMKRLTLLLVTAPSLALGYFAMAQMPQQDGARPKPPKPPKEMLAICEGKTEGAACSGKLAGGQTISGACHAPPSLPLACIPAGGMGPPGGTGGPPGGMSMGPPPSGQGAAIAATAADTSAVACGITGQGSNGSAGLDYRYTWRCAGGQRWLNANGVPDHQIGAFPNPGNPNQIAAQRIAVATTLNPVARSGAGAFVKNAGYALNGVKFDPGTAQSCTENCSNHGDSPFGAWRIEALGQRYFQFGVDANHAHVQPGGSYHYHGIPEGMLSAGQRAGKAMALIGWAVDGFPIYARFGHAYARAPDSPLRVMLPSYRLKARPDAGRPDVAMAAMGTFSRDWDYVAGSGDLDACNGRFDVTPEFPGGIYHYYATDTYPYIQRCVKGTPARAMADAGGPPPFGPGLGPPPFGPFAGAPQ